MNKVIIIGNLTRNPEVRQAQSGDLVTTFTVAVNRRSRGDHPEADYFRVSAWGELGSVCAQYLSKGRKVCVTGSVRAQGYVGQDGTARASLEVQAREVEFLTPKAAAEQEDTAETVQGAADGGYTEVDVEDVPF